MAAESTEVSEVGRTRPFADVLRDLNYGTVHSELSTRLQELIAAVIDTEKSGTLTLKLTVSPSEAYGQVFIADQVATKLPEHKRPLSIFFVDDENNLTRKDPRQMELPLREVPKGDQELRKIK